MVRRVLAVKSCLQSLKSPEMMVNFRRGSKAAASRWPNSPHRTGRNSQSSAHPQKAATAESRQCDAAWLVRCSSASIPSEAACRTNRVDQVRPVIAGRHFAVLAPRWSADPWVRSDKVRTQHSPARPIAHQSGDKNGRWLEIHSNARNIFRCAAKAMLADHRRQTFLCLSCHRRGTSNCP